MDHQPTNHKEYGMNVANDTLKTCGKILYFPLKPVTAPSSYQRYGICRDYGIGFTSDTIWLHVFNFHLWCWHSPLRDVSALTKPWSLIFNVHMNSGPLHHISEACLHAIGLPFLRILPSQSFIFASAGFDHLEQCSSMRVPSRKNNCFVWTKAPRA